MGFNVVPESYPMRISGAPWETTRLAERRQTRVVQSNMVDE